jgi:RNA-directed DNA polymerase
MLYRPRARKRSGELRFFRQPQVSFRESHFCSRYKPAFFSVCLPVTGQFGSGPREFCCHAAFAKSAVARPWERKFLGYSMTWHRKPKLRIAPESRMRITEKIRCALQRGRGQSMQQIIKGLNPVLRGWMAYFRLTEVKNVLEELDGWLRHKLRTLLWRQWKRVYRRARNLMKAGIDKVRAWKSATNGRGPWWNGGASHMNQAYPKNWFDGMGLVSLMDTHRRFRSVS